jgi:hypothetical protein
VYATSSLASSSLPLCRLPHLSSSLAGTSQVSKTRWGAGMVEIWIRRQVWGRVAGEGEGLGAGMEVPNPARTHRVPSGEAMLNESSGSQNEAVACLAHENVVRAFAFWPKLKTLSSHRTTDRLLLKSKPSLLFTTAPAAGVRLRPCRSRRT